VPRSSPEPRRAAAGRSAWVLSIGTCSWNTHRLPSGGVLYIIWERRLIFWRPHLASVSARKVQMSSFWPGSAAAPNSGVSSASSFTRVRRRGGHRTPARAESGVDRVEA
jgi:hypothetical protein